MRKYTVFNQETKKNFKNISIDKISLKILSSLDIEKVIQRRKKHRIFN